ncbi:MAG: hypothetical protein ABJ327_09875, partial [Litoreibacter sp.]
MIWMIIVVRVIFETEQLFQAPQIITGLNYFLFTHLIYLGEIYSLSSNAEAIINGLFTKREKAVAGCNGLLFSLDHLA